MQAKIMLIAFVTFTIIFGSLALFAFVQVDRLNREIEQLNSFPDRGFIHIQGIGNFAYVKMDIFAYAVVSFNNVTFAYCVPNATITGGYVYFFKITFEDGVSEELMASSFPTMFETDMTFTNHSNPKAGLLLIPQTGIYLLVSA